MAISNYSSADGLLTINGTSINDWGETQPSVSIEDINPRVALKRGLGGNMAAMDPTTTPKRLNVNLLPGSPQTRSHVVLIKSRVYIHATLSHTGNATAP